MTELRRPRGDVLSDMLLAAALTVAPRSCGAPPAPPLPSVDGPCELGPLAEFTDRDLHWVVPSCWTGPEASVDGLDWALVDQANADCALGDDARWQLGHAARSLSWGSFEFGERIVFNGLVLVSQLHVTADGTRTETYEVAGDAAAQRDCLQVAWGRGVDPAVCAVAGPGLDDLRR